MKIRTIYIFVENYLVNETIEVLALKIIDALEMELVLSTKDVKKGQACLIYNVYIH